MGRSKRYDKARKHGLFFDLARTIFNDPLLLTVANLEQRNKERRFSWAWAGNGSIVAVADLWFESEHVNRVRTISDRKRYAPPSTGQLADASSCFHQDQKVFKLEVSVQFGLLFDSNAAATLLPISSIILWVDSSEGRKWRISFAHSSKFGDESQ
ncbi:MAG: BrnT family toxin [Acidobacteriaceae bacterium]|nr:BrnT family toxin [Acidobacteriaceae bacterium]